MPDERCLGCHVMLPAIVGPVHAYVPSSPACWGAFCELGADEMRRFGHTTSRQFVVDAYMAQHPGDGSDRRERQSVFVHLVALSAVLESAFPIDRLPQLRVAAVAAHGGRLALTRLNGPGSITINDMVGAKDLDDYSRRAQRWAESVWTAWRNQHSFIRRVRDEIIQSTFDQGERH